MDDGIRPIDENGASELVFERVELGEERDLEERPLKSKVINAGVLVVAALISLLLLANIASSPSTYSGMYETLDEKKLNVMGLAATTTAASAAISVLPDDTGSAIANKLADFASYFVVILSVIYLEKFLLTTFGFLAFGILIPMACVLFAIAVFLRRGTLTKVNLQRLGTKLTAFGLALRWWCQRVFGSRTTSTRPSMNPSPLLMRQRNKRLRNSKKASKRTRKRIKASWRESLTRCKMGSPR